MYYYAGVDDSLAAVIKQERDSSSAEAAAMSVAASALNDLQHHIPHRDDSLPVHQLLHQRESLHITPRDDLPHLRNDPGLLSPTKLPPASIFKQSNLQPTQVCFIMLFGNHSLRIGLFF